MAGGCAADAEGTLKIPPEVTLVWADTGYGDMQDGGRVAAGQGAYFHVAMMNCNANQLSEMVPVSVIDEELGRYIKAGATAYFLVNTSDIRPVAMTTRAVMDAAWGGVPEGPDADMAFYRRWAGEEFGAKSADAVAAVYKEYFAAPSMRNAYARAGADVSGECADRPGRNTAECRGRMAISTTTRRFARLLLDRLSEGQVAAVPSQSPKWTAPRLVPQFSAEQKRRLLERDIEECEEAQPRWDAVWQHAVAAKSSDLRRTARLLPGGGADNDHDQSREQPGADADRAGAARTMRRATCRRRRWRRTRRMSRSRRFRLQ